jgi:transcriptional regulator with XRE-family HTH domain
MSEQATLGRVIRRLRHDRGLSMASLASKAGVSPKHLNLIELGHGNPTLMTLRRLRLALGVTLSEIVVPAEDEAARHPPTDGEG